MKDSRIGETLWSEWSGYDSPIDSTDFTFFTEEHVDVNNDVVKRALASCIQREGLVDSLGEAFRCIESESFISVEGYAGHIDGDTELTFCDSDLMTASGEAVDELVSITLVGFNV